MRDTSLRTALEDELFANPDITLPIPADGSLQVFAGYDEGPPKQRPSSDEAF